MARATAGRVLARVVARERTGPAIEDTIAETLFHERNRLDQATGDRTDGDRAFYARVAREARHAGPDRCRSLVAQILAHYTDEIRGHFDPRVYAVATRALPVGLSVLLHGLSPRYVLTHTRELANLESSVVITGEVDTLRSLAARGSVILVPTHTSNLDSLLLGLAIFQMGLPPFSYGAGLNLFTNPITSFFMNHLGAYTVDRRKTDPLYRETLKEFATVLLEWGHHSLFFPGGTRSRSGAVESHLKKGLLGTGLAALHNNLVAGRSKPQVFIVPATASYPLVLEAQSLVVDFLQQTGKWRFLHVEDEFNAVRRWADFLGGLLRLNIRVSLVIGRPMDPLGNDVEASGRSHDPRGRPVDTARYFMVDGALAEDRERDAEYTRYLAGRILGAFRADNVAGHTAIAAFALFELLRRSAPRLDLFRLLRSVGPESGVSVETLLTELDALLGELRALAAARRIRLGPEVTHPEAVLRQALQTFATYHPTPVIERRGERVQIGDANLLFYYRNRLEGYGLRGAPALVPIGGAA